MTSVTILVYHSIMRHASRKFLPLIVRPDEFAAQMACLNEFGYTPITVSQLASAIRGSVSKLPEKSVVITFDDGYADFYTQAMPLLAQYNFVATLYVTTSYIGGKSSWIKEEGERDRSMLTWDMLDEIQANDIEIGSHSHTHQQLDILDENKAYAEIWNSKQVLEQKLGNAVTTFSYPDGYYSTHTVRLVQKAGYQSACANGAAISSTSDNPHTLARISVPVNTGLADFRRWVRGEGWPVAPRKETVQAAMWRWFRKYRLENSISSK